jgi:hypothetical protein
MIKRYFATKDNTITNALNESLGSPSKDANMGQSDILEVFSIYGQTSSSSGYSREESRILISFDIEKIETDIINGIVPEDCSFFLKLFNAEHGATLPRNFELDVKMISGSWEEGLGLDMETYKDETFGNGSSWKTREGSTLWSVEGGDVWPNTSSASFFETGLENLEIDVTNQVNAWINGDKENDGFMVSLPNDYVSVHERSYYTKRFFARDTEFFDKKPVIEARWNSQTKDDRNNFYAHSPLLPAEVNNNTLYLYNYHSGRLYDIPAVGTGDIYVRLYDENEQEIIQCVETPATGGWVDIGIYSASLCAAITGSILKDVWFKGEDIFFEGEIAVKQNTASNFIPKNNLVISVTNRQKYYYSDSTSRFCFYIREKNWSPNIYTVAKSTPNTMVFDNLHYKIVKNTNGNVIVDYDFDNSSTLMSYDVNGNFFDIDTNILETGYSYKICLALFDNITNTVQELPFEYTFRVVKNEH